MISLTMTTAVFVVTLMEVVCRAIEKAMAYWNKHRHRPRRRPGITTARGIRQFAR